MLKEGNMNMIDGIKKRLLCFFILIVSIVGVIMWFKGNQTGNYNFTYMNKNKTNITETNEQKKSDFVDIKILFPDGRDYLLLTNKSISDIQLENCVFHTYYENEQQQFIIDMSKKNKDVPDSVAIQLFELWINDAME